MKYFISFFISLIFAALCAVAPITRNIQFHQNCAGYLKQAADANTIELCQDRLDKAIEYIEAHNLTEGYTSVLYRTEDENIGFWYNNLKACQAELSSVSEDATVLEKTNLLMKVRESLLDTGSEGTEITIPTGLAYYPNNALYGVLRIAGWILFFLPWCIIPAL